MSRLEYSPAKDLENYLTKLMEVLSIFDTFEPADPDDENSNSTDYSDIAESIPILDNLIKLYTTEYYLDERFINCISSVPYSRELLYLLRNINAPCIISSRGSVIILTKLAREDKLAALLLNPADKLSCFGWDDDILEANLHWRDELSYYRKGVPRNSRHLNWLMQLEPEDTTFWPEFDSRMANFVVENGTILKQSATIAVACCGEYYFYKELKINPQSVRYLSCKSVRGGIYTEIRLKRYIPIKKIVQNIGGTKIKQGIICDKLLVKFAIQRLRHLFNKSIVHGDMKWRNMVLNNRTRNKCVLIDYENSLDMTDGYFLDQANRKLYTQDGYKNYKLMHGQMLSENIYSYKADIINLIYSVVQNLMGLESSEIILLPSIRETIKANPLYFNLITALDKVDVMTNAVYDTLIEITNYYIIIDKL